MSHVPLFLVQLSIFLGVKNYLFSLFSFLDQSCKITSQCDYMGGNPHFYLLATPQEPSDPCSIHTGLLSKPATQLPLWDHYSLVASRERVRGVFLFWDFESLKTFVVFSHLEWSFGCVLSSQRRILFLRKYQLFHCLLVSHVLLRSLMSFDFWSFRYDFFFPFRTLSGFLVFEISLQCDLVGYFNLEIQRNCVVWLLDKFILYGCRYWRHWHLRLSQWKCQPASQSLWHDAH